MKKSLIALTLAALPVAAMADVTLYGQAKAGVEISQVKFGNKTAEKLGRADRKTSTATEIADFGSRIGFKGHEHVGNNLNAIWQIEQSTSVAGTSKGWGTRDSFIGLEGEFGKIRAGKLSSTVKDNASVDAWEYSNDALGLGLFTRNDERLVSARYDSPVFAGVSGSLQYAPRDNQDPADKYTHKELSNDKYYAGLNYENSGFFGQYAAGFAKNQIGDKDGQQHRLTAGYDANNLFVAVAGQYGKNWETYGDYAEALSNGSVTAANALGATVDEETGKVLTKGDIGHTVVGSKAGLDGKGVTTTEVAATAAYRMGNVTPRVSYAHGFKAKVEGEGKIDGSGYDQVVVGADYDFSKRTTAMVSAGWLRGGQSGTHKVETVAGLVGLRHKF